MGKSGSCNNLKTACSFLMEFATWIDSRVEIMHILVLCLPSIKFGCYGNLKLPLVYYGGNVDHAITSKIHVFFSYEKHNKWIEGKVEIMHVPSFC